MNTDEKDVAEVIEHMTVLVQSPGQNIGNIHKNTMYKNFSSFKLFQTSL